MNSSFFDAIGIGIAVTLVFGTVLGFFAFMRYLRYKETIELAKRGLVKESVRRTSGRISATTRSGIIVVAVGAGMTCGLLTIGMGDDQVFGPWLIPGIIPLFVGAGMVLTGWLDGDGKRPDDEPIAFDSSDFHDDHDDIPSHKITF